MFYVEETTEVNELVRQDDQLLILDGTSCLDYLNDSAEEKDQSWLQTFWAQLKNI